MVAILRQGLTRSLPLTGAAVAGVVVALSCAVLPGGWLDDLAAGIGLSALAPVGMTMRAVLALSGGVVSGAVVWAALYLLFGPGGPFAHAGSRAAAAAAATAGTQTIRRADAHPDAPPRRPLSAAAELAAPPASPIPAPPILVQPLPADLNAPLAAFDPSAILPVPREPVRPVPPLAPGERMEIFALQPDRVVVREIDEPRPSIDALLRRLEAGAERRVARAR